MVCSLPRHWHARNFGVITAAFTIDTGITAMPLTLTSLDQIAELPFDQVIDVRSPAEFAEDHIPGAVSLPALFDAERARVGTIYVKEDRFKARKIGAALVARNTAAHIEGPLATRDGGWRPLVYCWRGGQRSGSFASILGQIGWRADTIAGGYRTYRRLVVRALYETALAQDLILIDGGTGTAKTRLLQHLARAGAQVLDLEAMAAHRGSLFGPTDVAQPSQKAFESALATALGGMDPARPMFAEAESSRIGRITLPPALWARMRTAGYFEIRAPAGARGDHLLKAYPDLMQDCERLDATLAKLVPYHGRERVDAWRALAANGRYHALAVKLITTHYDPRYTRLARKERRLFGVLELDDLREDNLGLAAERILSQVEKTQG